MTILTGSTVLSWLYAYGYLFRPILSEFIPWLRLRGVALTFLKHASKAFGRRPRRSTGSASTGSTSSGTSSIRSPSPGDEDDFIIVDPPSTSRHRRHFSLPKLHIGSPATSATRRGTWDDEYKELSPPPYSQPKFLASEPILPSPAYEESNHGEYHELEHYSNLDLERETPSTRFTQCVDLSLEDFFHGKHLLYGFTKKLLGGNTLRQTLDIAISPGCPKDTVYCFPGVGHQLGEDLFQEIHLIFVEKAHPLGFKRIGHDISTTLRLPWTESLEKEPRRFSITGIDGKKYAVEIDYVFSKMVVGSVTFYEAGMPRPDGKGRGKFTIE